MRRVAIFGNTGGGKSTLAKRLAELVRLPLSRPSPGGTETDTKPEIQESIALTPIESAPASQINGLSTSELAPILDEAHRRVRVSPLAFFACALLFGATVLSKNQLLIGLAALQTTVLVPFAIFLDRYRRSVRIHYDLDDTAANLIAAALNESFVDLRACSYVWSIRAQGDTNDWKRNAGATKITKRQRIYPQTKCPSCIRGKVSFPAITIGAEELYFLPDAMLVVSPSSVAALHYKDFSAPLGQTRFIEEESVPPDTKVIGQTWRYVNKSGGPDRRLPICLYGEMAFVSSSGLNGLLHFSNPTAADRFAKVSEVLRGFDRSVSESKVVKSIRTPRHWPSILFWILFLTGALAIGIPALLKLSNSEYQAKLPNLLNFEPMSLPAKTEQPTKSQTIERATQNGTTPSRPTVITPSSSIPRVDQSKTQPVTAVPLPRPRPKPSSQN